MDRLQLIQELLLNLKAEGLYDKFLVQLNKDWARAGLRDNFDAAISPESLGRNMLAAIYELIITDFESYLNLLYAVDVPEKSIKALPEQRVDELAQAVSLLIAEREITKIRFKNKP